MRYIIPKSLHDLMEIQFEGFHISYKDEGLFIIDKEGIERVISNGLEIDEWFMSEFHKSSSSYLLQYLEYPFVILDYVSSEFKDYPIENIDFKNHLKDNVAVNKCERTFLMNGKPEYVKYKINGVLVAIRTWIFIVNSETGFPEDVKECLAYYRGDGSLGDCFLIKHEKYDPINDGDEIMTQLERPRKNIIKQLKGLVYKNISVADSALSHDQKLIMSGEFFRSYAAVINMFVEIGIAQGENSDDEYMVNKIVRDMIPENGVLKYPFLDHPFFANPSIKLYQVIIAKITY